MNNRLYGQGKSSLSFEVYLTKSRSITGTELQEKEKVHLAQRCCKGLMGAIEAGSELGADASGQLGSTETFYGVLGHFPLPLWRDGRRIHKSYPVDYLETKHRVRSLFQKSPRCLKSAEIHLTLTCLICSQKSLVTEDPDVKVTST